MALTAANYLILQVISLSYDQGQGGTGPLEGVSVLQVQCLAVVL